MKEISLPIGITANGLYKEAIRLFDAPQSIFELERAVHLLLFSKVALQEELLTESFCANLQRYVLFSRTPFDGEREKVKSDKIFGAVVAELMSVYSDAAIDLSSQLQEKLDLQDIEDAHFAIGMAEVTASNFVKTLAALEMCEISADSRPVLDDFFTNSTRFAASMKSVCASFV